MGRKQDKFRRYAYSRSAMLIGLTALAIAGCGTPIGDRAIARTLLIAECDNPDTNDMSPDLVMLDWTGGTNAIYPDHSFEALAFELFPTSDGGTLADDPDRFMELVREEVTQIFCEWPEVSVVVRNGEDDEARANTIVHISQSTPPNGGSDIGEAEYDPCNEQDDNVALIFGERIRQLGDEYSFEEWVTVFANVTAHEIGHTLGYGHVPFEERPEPGRARFVELMLSRHTMAEMRQTQRLVVDQTYCEKTVNRRAADTPYVLSCGVHTAH